MSDYQNNNYPNHGYQPQMFYQQPSSNGIGVAGFVLSLLSLFFGWVPFLGWLMWILGLIFSFVGVFKKPRGLAIAGLVISLIGFILLFVVFASLGVMGAAASAANTVPQ